MEKIAKGSWQKEIFDKLISYKEVPDPVYRLRGLAKIYSGKYERSLYNLFSRMEAAGYEIEWIPGVRGGRPTGKFRLI